MTEQEKTRTTQDPPKTAVAKEMLYALKFPAVALALAVAVFTIPYSVGFAIDQFVEIEYAFAGGDTYANRSILGFTVVGSIGVTVGTVFMWYSAAKDRAKEKTNE